MINFIFKDRNFTFKKNQLKKNIQNIIQSEGFVCGDISIVICSDDYLLELNKKHLNHDYYTDIITFDYSDKKIISGDLLISLDRVKENSIDLNLDLLSEFKRIVFHGVLHLCTYKDKSDIDKKMMTSKEDFYLSLFDS